MSGMCSHIKLVHRMGKCILRFILMHLVSTFYCGQYKTWTADCGLRTTDCGLGIKHGLGIKCGLRTEYKTRTRYKMRTAD